MATRLRYTVYDTNARRYLKYAEQPMGTDSELVTDWTRRAENAMRFPGVKSAAAMVAKLGRYNNFVVKNEKGDVVA